MQLGAISHPAGVPISPLWKVRVGGMVAQGHQCSGYCFMADQRGEKYTLRRGEQFSCFWGFNQAVSVGGEHPGAETP